MSRSVEIPLEFVANARESVSARLHESLVATTALASDEVKAAAAVLSQAAQPAIELGVQDVVVAITQDLSASGVLPGSLQVVADSRDLTLRFEPGEADSDEPAPTPDPSTAGGDPAWATATDATDGTVRLTLRLPQGLRDAAESASRASGQSLNAWLVSAAMEKLQRHHTSATPRTHTQSRSARRVTGWSS